MPVNKIHPLNLRKWIAVNDAIGAGLTGLDFITTNISNPEGYVIDVNARPQNDINLAALPRHEGDEEWFAFKPGWTGQGRRRSWESVVPCYYRDRCRCGPKKDDFGNYLKFTWRAIEIPQILKGRKGACFARDK